MNANSSQPKTSNVTIASWLKQSTGTLQKAKIASARLDCLLILEHILQKDRAWLLAHDDTLISPIKTRALQSLLKARVNHMPLAYLTQIAHFYGRTFFVNQSVLVPRPETEDLIEILKQSVQTGFNGTIIDCGTGSGILAVTAAKMFTRAKVHATDISYEALQVAKTNNKNSNAGVVFHKTDLLPRDIKRYNQPIIIMANLPYVPQDYPINAAAHHEPSIALYGGADGLRLYSKLFSKISLLPNKPFAVITEALQQQHQPLKLLAESYGYSLSASRGLAQGFVTS